MMKCVIILLGGGAALLYANRVPLKLAIVLAVLLLQFLWIAWPRDTFHRQAEDFYRITERLEARQAWLEHPSPETKAAYDNERRLLSAHCAPWEMASIALILILDGGGIYYFWKNGTKAKSAQQA